MSVLNFTFKWKSVEFSEIHRVYEAHEMVTRSTPAYFVLLLIYRVLKVHFMIFLRSFLCDLLRSLFPLFNPYFLSFSNLRLIMDL